MKRGHSKRFSALPLLGVLLLISGELLGQTNGSPVRVAIGTLGMPDDEKNGRLSDLVVAELSSAKNFEFVDRQSLNTVLEEAEMSLSGLVRAKDAVRVGKLLRADWFLLGTSTTVSGTNAILMRVVDAKSGVIRDLAVFREVAQMPKLASELASLLRRSSRTSDDGAPRVYLAIGGFEDLSLNNRLASFPAQLRSHLATYYQGSKVTLLERELASALMQEVRMDLAGLTESTEGAATVAPSQMQAAFWIVDGFYQSYELAGPEVDLILRMERVLGGRHLVSLREKVDEQVFRHAREAIDKTMAKESTAPTRPPTRKGEVDLQMARGKERSRLREGQVIFPPGSQAFFIGGAELQDDPIKKRRNIEEAIQAFETVLLLDPEHREAKMYLAACLQYAPLDRIDEARNYYREIIGSSVRDRWSDEARLALAFSYYDIDNRKAAELFRTFANQCTTPQKVAECRTWLVESLQRLRIDGGISTESLLPYVDEQVLGDLEGVYARAKKENKVQYFDLNAILHACRFDEAATAKHVNELLPRLKQQFPELIPYLLLQCLVYQTDTNAPVVKEFRESLESCASRPQDVFQSESYFGRLQGDAYRWAFNSKLYDLAIRMAEVRRQVAAQGLTSDLGDADKVRLAYAYVGLEKWKEAIEILESFGNRTIDVGSLSRGPWGSPFDPFIPAKLVETCRQHVDGKTVGNAGSFKLGDAFIRLKHPFAFAAESDSVWIAESNLLLQLDAGAKKIKEIRLPRQADVPITCLGLGPEQIWVGTEGDGLFECNKASGDCRRFTEENGLLLNEITCLYVQNDVLWIGFGHTPPNRSGQVSRGGVGRLDLRTRHFSALTPPLVANANDPDSLRNQVALDSRNGPPRAKVVGIAEGVPGELWLAVWQKGVQRYRIADRTWETYPTSDRQNSLRSLVADQQGMVAGCTDSFSFGEASGGLSLHSFRDQKWQRLYMSQGLPANRVTALALDDRDVWIGGGGFIAVMNLDEKKIRKVCDISSGYIDRLQVEGGFVWIQTLGSLYKLPTSSAR